MRFTFRRRKSIFLQLAHDQAQATLDGMEALNSYLTDQNQVAAARLKAKEKEADETRRILINELNRSFVTPFDREDIFALSRSIDDVLDYAYSTLLEIELLKVKPTSYMQGIANLLCEGAGELLQAVDRLQDHPGVANEHVQRAKAVENKVEEIYWKALADLFTGVEDTKHIVKILKQREVFRHLSNAADRVADAADVIADIVVKTS